MKNNKISKPLLHTHKDDLTTAFYKVDLSINQINEICDLLLELEVSYVNDKGETTPMASFYASLVDQWNRLNEFE